MWVRLLELLERALKYVAPYLAGYLAAQAANRVAKAEAKASALESRLDVERGNSALTHADRLSKLAAQGRLRDVPADDGK